MVKKNKKTEKKKTVSQLEKEVKELKEYISKIESKVDKSIKKNIKERAILENQKVGKKIDSIMDDDFIEEIKGRKDKPGIKEQMRNNEKDHENYNRVKKHVEGNGELGLCGEQVDIKRSLKRLWVIVIVMAILELGGSFRGVTWNSVREKFGLNPKTKQVEQSSASDKKPIVIVEKSN